MTSTQDRLLHAIREKWGTLDAAADALHYDARQFRRWRKKLPKVIIELEQAGILHITGDCPCGKPDDVAA